jgi:hypothetical protein
LDDGGMRLAGIAVPMKQGCPVHTKTGVALLVVAVAIVLGAPRPAQADSYGFFNITSNDAEHVTIALSQLHLDVRAVGDTQVSFTFLNEGSRRSSVTDVYFDNGPIFGDGSLRNIADIVDADNGGDADVNFSRFALPVNLPGAALAEPDFQTTLGFSADANGLLRRQHLNNGVQPGDSLTIVFNIKEGLSFSDVLAEIASEELRVGIHVQGFPSRTQRAMRRDGLETQAVGSESFINVPSVVAVPEPGSVLTALAGLLVAAGVGRRRR